MHPAALFLLIGVPVGIGIAVLATRDDEPADDVELPENVKLLRTKQEIEREAKLLLAMDQGDVNGVGIAYFEETTPVRRAIASVARRHPSLLFVGTTDAAVAAAAGEPSGVNLRCPAWAAGAVGGERGGNLVGFECWRKGADEAQIESTIAKVAAKV